MKAKILLPLLASFIVTGCALPGTSLSMSDKTTVNTNDQNKDNKENINETINVYTLSSRFISKYSSQDSLSGDAQVNLELDKLLENYEYKIGVGDVLNITIWDHPELTIPAGSYRSAEEAGNWVHSDGTIFYPYIGFLVVKDKTVNEIRNDISHRLKRVIESPQVDVNLAAFRSQKVYITGEINKPGKQPITNVPLTLLDAINQAGGITDDADWRNVTVTREGVTENISLFKLMQEGNLTQNRLMKGGDIVHIPRNDGQKVFVLGEIEKPTVIKIGRTGMTLTEALTTAGGIKELSADATGIFVIRSTSRDSANEALLNVIQKENEEADTQEDNKATNIANIYQLDISDASALMIGTEFELEAYDVVYITTSPIGVWNKILMQLMPSINALNTGSEAMLRIRNW